MKKIEHEDKKYTGFVPSPEQVAANPEMILGFIQEKPWRNGALGPLVDVWRCSILGIPSAGWAENILKNARRREELEPAFYEGVEKEFRVVYRRCRDPCDCPSCAEEKASQAREDARTREIDSKESD